MYSVHNMAQSLAEIIPFSDICRLCEKISSSAREKKVEIFKKYLTHFRDLSKKFQEENAGSDVSFHPIFRLLLPQLDLERGAYGLKEHTLATIYIKILCLPKEGQDADKLLNFRTPRFASNKSSDFADVAFWVLKKYCPEVGKMSVQQVNTHLDNLAAHNAANQRRMGESELLSTVQSMPAMEQKWFIRILLKEMKLGMGQKIILRTFHPDAQELYDISNNLEKVCRMLRDPSQRMNEIEVEIFSPFRPMLAEQCDVQKVDEILKKHLYCYVETKYDGERFQLHFKNGSVKYFSRNGKAYNESFDRILTPHLVKQLRSDLHTCILDGEMMVWDNKKKFFRPKGENIDVKSLTSGGNYQPCFCAFDVLLCNDDVLTNKPLEDRLRCLQSMFSPAEGIIAHTVQRRVTSREEVMEELNHAIDNKLEGIMLKQPATVYKPNNRKAGWFKIKPEYTDGVMDHIDAVIIGGYYGDGRKQGIINHFLLALAVPNKNGGDPIEFHSVARVGSGYSLSKLEELLQKLSPHWQRVKPGQLPPGLVWTKDKPDLWIEPRNSYILEIKATEMTRSKMFKVEHTLRFPRVEHIRYDKNWNDCMTIEEYEALRQLAAGKLYSRHVVPADNEASPRKKRRPAASVAPITLAKQFRGADLTNVEQVATFLQDKEFCVLNGNEELTKEDIEKKIHQNGGTLVANPGAETFCVVFGKRDIRVNNIVKCGQCNVAHLDWLLRTLECGRLVPWTPADLISTTATTAQDFSMAFDKYGDSYTTPATADSLKHCLNQVDDAVVPNMEQMAELDAEMFDGPNPFGIFRLCYAYFDKYSEVNDPQSESSTGLDVAALEFRFYGGIVQECITCDTTHVVIHSRIRCRLDELQKLNRERTNSFHIVTEDWIEQSAKEHKRLKEWYFREDQEA